MGIWMLMSGLNRMATQGMIVCGEVTLLKRRVITAIAVIVLLYVSTVWFPPLYFVGAVSLVLLIALLEWTNLAGWHKPLHRLTFISLFILALSVSVVFVGSPVGETVNVPVLAMLNLAAIIYWLICFRWIRLFPGCTAEWDRPGVMVLMGIVSLLPVWWALIWLRMLDENGLLVFVVIALVSISDIGAYFSGRTWGTGRARLAGELSPNKSWVGFWGGMVSCVTLAAVLLSVLHISFQPVVGWLWPLLLLAAALLATFSVLGDLFISMLKRQRGIKDCGRILPGHGGVLDRVDSLLPAAPVFVLGVILLITGTRVVS